MRNVAARPNSIVELASLALLLLLYLVVALGHAYLAPLTTGPDELAHYEYVNFIVEHGRLPLTTAERAEASYKSDQPPLYHLLAALPAALVPVDGPPFLKRYSDNPRRQLIERTRHAWGLYNTLDEQWPYRGEVLRWQVGRWVAVFFGLLTVLSSYLLARWFFAGRWPLALAAAAIVAFVPRFALTGSMLNYETTVAFFATLFLWLLLKFANLRMSEFANERAPAGSPFSRVIRHLSFVAFLIGLAAGLAIVTKLSALILPLEIFIAFLLIGRAAGQGWKVWGRWLLLAAIGVLIPVGLWYGFVVAQFNTVAQDGLYTGLLRPLVAADASDATTNQLLSFLTGGQAGFTGAIQNLDSGPPWQWAATMFRTFWVVGIEGVQPLGALGLTVAGALVAMAGAGLLRLWVEAGPLGRNVAGSQGRRVAGENKNTLFATRHSQLAIRLLLLHLLLPLVLPLLRYLTTFSLADTAQGRHVLFLAAPALALLLVWGITAATWQVQQSYQNRFTHYVLHFTYFLPGLFLFGWSLVQLQTMTWAYLPPLPVTTIPARVPPIEHRVEDSLSPYVTLLGYETRLDSTTRLLRVDLWWRADAVSPVDYLTHLVLLDAAGQPQSEWQGYPAGGRYPTRAWDPGDITHDTIWLSVGGLEAGDYDLALQLRPTANRYPPQAQARPLTLGQVTLPESTLRVFESAFPIPALGAAAGYTVWQNGRPVTRARPFRYRETIAVSLPSLPATFSRRLQMLTHTPAGQVLAFDPVLLTNTQALFIVGPDWPSGDYYLQATITNAQQHSNVGNSVIIATVTDRWERDFATPTISRPIYANFANQVELMGYDLGANRAEPGGGLPLTLYWRGLDWMGQDYTIFTKLIKIDDQSVHGGRDRLPREGYRTLYWAPGEVVTDPFGLPVEANAPDGIYRINVGLYKKVNGQAVSLPLVQDDAVTGITSVNLGLVKIGATPSGLTIESASPQNPVNIRLGDQIELLGFDLTQGSGIRIQDSGDGNSPNSLDLTLYWQAVRQPDTDYTTFVHVLNAAGETVAQKDQPPLNGDYPTSLWEPGEVIADEIEVPLPPDLPPGRYAVVVGLYNFASRQRLSVPGSPASEVALTQLEVSAP